MPNDNFDKDTMTMAINLSMVMAVESIFSRALLGRVENSERINELTENEKKYMFDYVEKLSNAMALALVHRGADSVEKINKITKKSKPKKKKSKESQ